VKFDEMIRCRVDKETKEKMNKVCCHYFLNVSQYIRKLIEESLKQECIKGVVRHNIDR